jgi:hypothetical protein
MGDDELEAKALQWLRVNMKRLKKAKEVFGDKLTLYFAKNNYEKKLEYISIDVQDIDKQLPEVYNITDLKEALKDA